MFCLSLERPAVRLPQFNSRYERIKNWAAITAGYYVQFFHIPMMSPWTPILSLLVQKSFQKNCSTLYHLIQELENVHGEKHSGMNLPFGSCLLILLLSITSLHFLLFTFGSYLLILLLSITSLHFLLFSCPRQKNFVRIIYSTFTRNSTALFLFLSFSLWHWHSSKQNHEGGNKNT